MTVLAFLLSTASMLWAAVSFENPDINSRNQVLFSVYHDIPGSPAYRTLFLSDAAKTGSSGTKILSCYPEKMELLSGGSILQVRNRYGTARYSIHDATLAWLSRADTVPADSMRLSPQAVSPDGKWLCYVRKTSFANGQLILKNTANLSEKVLDARSDFSYERVNVLWAPDSSIVAYEKDGMLYFCDPKAAFQQVQMTEEYRKIGSGSIRALCWASDKSLFYIDRDVVYKINASELFTRGLYAPMVGSGVVCGRLPVAFDSAKDRFWINPEGTSLAVLQSDRIITCYSLKSRDAEGLLYLPVQYASPFSDVRGSVTDFKLFWLRGKDPVLWADLVSLADGSHKSAVSRLGQETVQLSFIDDAGAPAVSPDGTRLAFASNNSLYVYDLATWKNIARLDGERTVSCLWCGNSTLFVGGVSTVRRWTFESGSSSCPNVVTGSVTLFLSAGSRVFWNGDGGIRAEDAVKPGVFYDYDSVRGAWTVAFTSAEASLPEKQPVVQNGRYRVFVGSTPNPRFDNTLYIRTLTGTVDTRPLFPDTAAASAPKERIALVFDAMDSADGLSRILSVLSEYRVAGTFFMNGEFIRRYPGEVKQIVSSGYECASLFFTAADLTGKDFVVDADFIKRGLARNEDEFYTTTGKELSLFWHAPYYKATSEIKKAGEKAGYRYIDAGKLSLDTVTLEGAVREPSLQYMTASQIISYYLATVQDGYMIPVSTGITGGTRSDYLYEKLDLLIGALLDAGFEIVPLRTLL
ncbi:MAG: polysaccharide deacetylase family protein [Treponema sp.]|nr:polysaccharide deacetylase family protein [Treponema sp.]